MECWPLEYGALPIFRQSEAIWQSGSPYLRYRFGGIVFTARSPQGAIQVTIKRKVPRLPEVNGITARRAEIQIETLRRTEFMKTPRRTFLTGATALITAGL